MIPYLRNLGKYPGSISFTHLWVKIELFENY